ncbi:major facilitator superfamily MFS_1 [Pseudarthrobacter chlorophenolicus A6]|uniref:Major facilitator superfamily MFS_1 n=1 Tax=Pseudarthrobacter chlorophenolicus (strain ATCC 700700 / DSM 12829 / CIP 107037 / JCM 12360 / KCTC 9906 / NCIMB 13794 / A6) TaxID=452863 RepID=B8H9Q6_PSECP|nr:MFS transporter [Pseudarthrobacter chlorophenolicus]ACL38290.1 major facilitator superfamily MFS_1 [Pseudarthrobacter chlorophenolicus A6]SDQ51609.1 Major Facilitator Superfamily protein [Pseudarthrobacter chlorophenolicus]
MGRIAGTSTPPAAGTPSPRAALWLCLGAGFVTLLDQSVFVLAVPAMAAGLHADSGQVQWILASYSLAFGVALVPAGRLGDLLGRRKLFIAGVAVFGAFSLLGGLASDPAVVIAARLLQGLGAGTLNPQVLGLLQDIFTGSGRAKALGYYAAAGGTAAVCGPLVGGIILSAGDPALSWRLLFLVNVPLVLVLVPLALVYLPRAAPQPGQVRPGSTGTHGTDAASSASSSRIHDPSDAAPRRSAVDVPGAVLLGAVVVASLVPTIYGPGPVAVLWAGLGAAAVLAFAGWEFSYHRRGRTPLLSPALVKSPGYLLGTVVALCQFGVGAAMAAVTSLYFLSGTGLPPLAAAAILAPQAAGMLLASSLSWRFVARHGRTGIVAAIAAALACLPAKDWAVQAFDAGAAAAIVAGVGLLQGVATGLVVAPNQTLTLAHAPQGAAGVAAGFYQLSQRFSAALCSAAAAGMFLGQGASGGNAREAFHQGILLCCALLAAALLAGGADAVRIAMAGRKARAAVARSEKESTTTALAPVPAEPADA